MYKIPKGTNDLVGDTFPNLIESVKNVFESYGAEYLETPVFERSDVLLNKYGEEAENKLLYKLVDQGGEDLTLRYDLTVPFMRYVKENNIKKMRRYSIGKVYRRDQPNQKQARYREFYQADFDIYGEKEDPMVAETILLSSVCKILDKYKINYKILINDVNNLNKILEECNIPSDKWKKVCSIIDKLDKTQFESLIPEFISCYPEIDLVKLKQLLDEKEPMNQDTKNNLELLKSYMEIYNLDDRLVFTNSLARGLDYYTGFIWEFKCDNLSTSISAGGRYDNLLGSSTHACGISIGLSRLYDIIKNDIKTWKHEYYVTTLGNVSIKDKLSVIAEFQKGNNIVGFSLIENDGKLTKVINDCLKKYTRYLVIIAENEWKDGKVLIKDLENNTQECRMLKTN